MKAVGSYVNDKTLALPNNKYVLQVTDNIGKGIESIENIGIRNYAIGSAAGFTVSSGSQYLINGNINYSDALKTGVVTPYVIYTSPITALTVGYADSTISAKLNGSSMSNSQYNYLKNTLVMEGITKTSESIPYLNRYPSYIGLIGSEISNQIEKGDKK